LQKFKTISKTLKIERKKILGFILDDKYILSKNKNLNNYVNENSIYNSIYTQ